MTESTRSKQCDQSWDRWFKKAIVAFIIGLTFAMTIAIVAAVLAVIAATAEGGGAGRTNVGQINMMRGMFAGVVPEDKKGPLCDACVDIFAQVNELLNDPAFQDQVSTKSIRNTKTQDRNGCINEH